MQLRSIGVAVLAATVLLVAAPPEAGAMTFGSAREELAGSGLSPQPLFPDRVPAKLARADVTLTIADSEQGMGANDYAVDFFLAHAFRGDPRIVGFRRFPRASLREAVRGWRAKRNPFKLVRHAGRLRYAYRGDISFGYAWVQDGKAYFASSKYYGGFTWRDLARLVSSLRHLPGVPAVAAGRETQPAWRDGFSREWSE